MFALDTPSVLYVSVLFGGYSLLWAVKRREVLRKTGTDPDVMGCSTDRLQGYIATVMNVMTGFVVVLIAVHAVAPRTGWGLNRLSPLEGGWFDLTGLVVGLAGLALSRAAQTAMGTAWRVGIDEQQATPLVTAGIFRHVRNPTYSGLFLVMAGLWLVWPTPLVTLFVALFVFMIEVQVRREEEYLITLHGERYEAYAERTPRYLPRMSRREPGPTHIRDAKNS
jgi:protein-S-isoprenylcysteine O-methyltransferase Ste14